MVALMLVGGAGADRFPRAVVLRGCNLAQGIGQAIAAALVLTGTAQIWHLVVLQFVSGTVFAASYPAFHGMVPILLSEPANQPQKWLAKPQGSATPTFLEALKNFMYWENYDVRVRMDGKIDRVVLEDILHKRAARAKS